MRLKAIEDADLVADGALPSSTRPARSTCRAASCQPTRRTPLATVRRTAQLRSALP